MTVLAGHTRPQGLVGHLAIRYRVAGVAAEAHLGFAQLDLSTDGLFEIAGLQILVAGSEIETRN